MGESTGWCLFPARDWSEEPRVKPEHAWRTGDAEERIIRSVRGVAVG